ncbi:MAG: hypothetical protein LBD89_00105 [Tannerellaceae bacterium]|jgi:hypothetical protein|nr:hypothetical protein [Tannerellaceae bacterium]
MSPEILGNVIFPLTFAKHRMIIKKQIEIINKQSMLGGIIIIGAIAVAAFNAILKDDNLDNMVDNAFAHVESFC